MFRSVPWSYLVRFGSTPGLFCFVVASVSVQKVVVYALLSLLARGRLCSNPGERYAMRVRTRAHNVPTQPRIPLHHGDGHLLSPSHLPVRSTSPSLAHTLHRPSAPFT